MVKTKVVFLCSVSRLRSTVSSNSRQFVVCVYMHIFISIFVTLFHHQCVGIEKQWKGKCCLFCTLCHYRYFVKNHAGTPHHAKPVLPVATRWDLLPMRAACPHESATKPQEPAAWSRCGQPAQDSCEPPRELSGKGQWYMGHW